MFHTKKNRRRCINITSREYLGFGRLIRSFRCDSKAHVIKKKWHAYIANHMISSALINSVWNLYQHKTLKDSTKSHEFIFNIFLFFFFHFYLFLNHVNCWCKFFCERISGIWTDQVWPVTSWFFDVAGVVLVFCFFKYIMLNRFVRAWRNLLDNCFGLGR